MMNPLPKIIIGAIVVIGLIAGGISLATHGLLQISAPNLASGQTLTVELTLTEGKIEKFTLTKDQTRAFYVPTGSVRISGLFDKAISINVENVKAARITQTKLIAGTRHAIQKTGSNIEYCPLLVGTVQYSYTCYGYTDISRHNPVTPGQLDSRVSLFDSRQFVELKPVANGFLTYVFDELEFYVLHFIDVTNQKYSPVTTIPSSLQQKIGLEHPTIITPEDSTKGNFALVFNKSAEVYSFKHINDPSPVRLSLPSTITKDNITYGTIFRYSGSQLTSFTGAVDHPAAIARRDSNMEDDQQEENALDQAAAEQTGSFVTYDETGRVSSTVTVPKAAAILSFHKLPNNYYASLSGRGATLYAAKSNRLTMLDTIPEVTSLVVSQNKAYMQSHGTIFAFTAKSTDAFSLTSAFTSSALSASELYLVDGKLSFTATAARFEPRPLDVFFLLDNITTEAPFDEQLQSNLRDISSSLVGFNYDAKTLQFIVSKDYANFPNLAQLFQQRIATKKINIGGRTVTAIGEPPR